MPVPDEKERAHARAKEAFQDQIDSNDQPFGRAERLKDKPPARPYTPPTTQRSCSACRDKCDRHRESHHEEPWLSTVPAGVDGVWGPSKSNNLTVHLDYDIREDLSEEIEDFCQLYKMGSFKKAHSFFEKSLAGHKNKPYVFVMYAEMLLRQGSYDTLCELDDSVMRHVSVMRNVSGEDAEQTNPRLLEEYWKLMLSLARMYSMRPRTALSREDLSKITALNVSEDNGSIEIGMICKILQAQHLFLFGDENCSDSRLNHELSTEPDLRYLYDHLLRAGRVWDMHDFLQSFSLWRTDECPWTKITGYPPSECLQRLIQDWTGLCQQDASTTLALLDLLTSLGLGFLSCLELDSLDMVLDYATPLAKLLIEQDSALTKTRGYTQWIIAKAGSIAFRTKGILDYQNSLKSYPGISSTYGLALPQYIPINSENPGWRRPKVSSNIVNALNLAVNNARDLGDYEVQEVALKYLIMISDSPVFEFGELCELQKQTSGKLQGYMHTLLSSYLISTTEKSKTELKQSLEKQVSSHGLGERLPRKTIWEARVIIFALEKAGPGADKAQKTADDCFERLDHSIRQTIAASIPDYVQQVKGRQAARRTKSELDRIDAGETQLKKEKKDLSNTTKTRWSSLESGLILKPPFSEGKKVTLTVDDMEDSTNQKTITYRPEPPYQLSKLTEHIHKADLATPRNLLLSFHEDDDEFTCQRLNQPDHLFSELEDDDPSVQIEKSGIVLGKDRHFPPSHDSISVEEKPMMYKTTLNATEGTHHDGKRPARPVSTERPRNYNSRQEAREETEEESVYGELGGKSAFPPGKEESREKQVLIRSPSIERTIPRATVEDSKDE